MFDAGDIWTPDRTCLVPLERVHKYVTLVGDLCTVWFTSDVARYIVENVHVEWMPQSTQSMRLKETPETEWAFHLFAYEWELWDRKVRGDTSLMRMSAIHYTFQDVQSILDLKKKRKREPPEDEPDEEELARAKKMLRSMTGSENPSEELIEQAQELNETANAVVHASAVDEQAGGSSKKSTLNSEPDPTLNNSVKYDVGFVGKTESYYYARTLFEESRYYPKESREYKLDKESCRWINALSEHYAKQKLKAYPNLKVVLIKTMTSKTVEPFVPADEEDDDDAQMAKKKKNEPLPKNSDA